MNTKGVGLGLYIAKKIVEQFRGKVWLDSKQGEGSTFYLSIELSD